MRLTDTLFGILTRTGTPHVNHTLNERRDQQKCTDNARRKRNGVHCTLRVVTTLSDARTHQGAREAGSCQ